MSMDSFEQSFWSTCQNTFGEELKQLTYANRMGIPLIRTWRSGFNFDAGGKSIVDIGGGPVSVLLKMENRGPNMMVIDPGPYPYWVGQRYAEANIAWDCAGGEVWVDVADRQFDLALIYNCLQHVESPKQVIKRAIKAVGSSGLRMFEWIDIPPHEGHPHMLTEAALNEWTGREGVTETFTGENECHGRAWYLGPDLRGGAAGATAARWVR
jgi:2-polyprenyl-3-methyl-5-hydroxy-6-metoxy-1,4-benzoquinol methylase